jgi:thioesterase domain-containing protein/acyl carrier protein
MAVTKSHVENFAKEEAGVVTPRSDLEQRILHIWIEVLGTSAIGVTDNFYDVGGDSLRAVQVISQIEAEFNISLPPSRLYDAATIEKQARVLASEPAETTPEQRNSLVFEIRSSTSGTPLFCFPGNCGGVSPFYPLAERLGQEHGVSVVLYSYLERNTPTPSMRELAASCLQGIKSVQPAGPYHLSGYCFGASVAYEVARQLERAGEKVASLALLDPEPGLASWPLRRQMAYTARKFTARVRSLVVSRQPARQAAAAATPAAKPGVAVPDKIAHFQRAAHSILQAYKHLPYAGPLAIFHSADGHNVPDISYWRGLARGAFESHCVPGNHFTMLQEPNVSGMAEILQKRFCED